MHQDKASAAFHQLSQTAQLETQLSALMGLRAVWVWTHDSVALGEDGTYLVPVYDRLLSPLTLVRLDAAAMISGNPRRFSRHAITARLTDVIAYDPSSPNANTLPCPTIASKAPVPPSR